MALNVVLLGPPGAGKGTQAEILLKKYDFPHISTGDMLREEVKLGTEHGLKAKEFMNRGELVPDELVVAMVKSKLESNSDSGKTGFLLDGFPRTKEQAEALDAMLSGIGIKTDVVVYFKTSEDVILKRLTGRWLCRKCGKIYNIPNMMPKKEGVCDICGGELYQRRDDKKETIVERLKVYDAQTAPLIAYYRQKGLLEEVSGDQEAVRATEEIDRLFEKITSSLKK